MARAVPAEASVDRKIRERDPRSARLELLEDLLMDIALIADGHRTSKLYIDGENAALVNIRNMAAVALGLKDQLVDRGTLLAPVGTVCSARSPRQRSHAIGVETR
ncbi:hypothetical protein GOB57_09990 [Sinorhizobium meliloti]|nr:hypothetical protein [Sinorhizobium meliloti]